MGGERGERTALAVLVLLLAGLAASLAPPASGEEPPTLDAQMFERLDAFLELERVEAGIPGLAVAVVVGAQVAHIRALGEADGTRRPVTPDTPFLLASLSKAFTATAIMQLVEQQRVELDAPVQHYIPWFRVADEQASSQITIRHLLHHTSGLPERRPAGDQDRNALERFVRSLSSTELVGAPGERHHYTNAAYNVLGLVVETVSEMAYDQYLAQHIYAPLGMTRSHALAEEAQADGASEGFYRWFGLTTAPTQVDLPRAEAASATTFSSANDMARWLIAHMNGGGYGDRRILSEASTRFLHTAGAEAGPLHAYAMGWFVRPLWEDVDPTGDQVAGAAYTVPALIEHGGAWPTGHTYIGFVPERNWGFVLLMNLYDETIASRYHHVEQGILQILSGKEPAPALVSEPPLIRYGKQIGMTLLALLLASLAWAVTRVRRWRNLALTPRRWRTAATALFAPLALDLFVLWLLLVDAPTYGASFEGLIRWTPDLPLILIPALILAGLFAPFRTAVFMLLLVRGRPYSWSTTPATTK